MIPPLTTTLDPSDCPICGEWRDSPTADCANCGWSLRPCGDALGLCVYAAPHDGPHKIAGSWKDRLAAQPAPPTEALRMIKRMAERFHGLSEDPIHLDHVFRDCPDEYCAEARRYLASTEEGT